MSTDDDEDVGWTKFARAEKVITDFNVRCANKVRLHGTDGLEKLCNTLLAERVTRPYTITCRKCKQRTIVEE